MNSLSALRSPAKYFFRRFLSVLIFGKKTNKRKIMKVVTAVAWTVCNNNSELMMGKMMDSLKRFLMWDSI